MNYPTKFDIKLDQPWEAYSAPPADPLGELTHLEMGLWQFCYEHNHRVLIQIGEEERFVFLDYDFSLILPEFPNIIHELSSGRNSELDFSESYFYIKFEASNNKVKCSLNDFGSKVKTQKFEFAQSQILEVLKLFLDEIVRLVVAGGYIQSEAAREFLAAQ